MEENTQWHITIGFISAHASGEIIMVTLLVLADLPQMSKDFLAASWSRRSLIGRL